jgi:prepilin-type N-terminal cleavage/methylation domain-containing protein
MEKIKNNKAAFSLIEILVVLAILMIVISYSFLNLSDYRKAKFLEKNGEMVIAALRNARERSIVEMEGKRWGVHFVNQGGKQTYTIFNGSNFASSTTRYNYHLKNDVLWGFPFSSSTLDVIFNPLVGTVSSSFFLSLINKKNDGLMYAIFVNNLGNVFGRLEKGVRGYWSFDEYANSDVVYDASGNGNNGNLISNPKPTRVPGKSGSALSFNGSNYVEIPNPKNIPQGNSPYAIVVFIKTNFYCNCGIVGWGNWGTTNAVNALKLSSSGIINYWEANDLILNVSGLTDGKWHMIVAQFDGKTRSIYVDGNLIGSDTPTGHNAVLSNFRIGSTNNGEYFNGAIDELVIYDRALTEDEIKTIYNSFK